MPGLPLFTLTNPAPQPQSYFGDAVAISGQRVLIGASQEDTGLNGAGLAYVYDLTGATPTKPALTLINPNSTVYGSLTSPVRRLVCPS